MQPNDKPFETGKELNREASSQRTRDRQVYSPRVDIVEDAEGLELLVDLPGADESRVSVTLEKNVLKIEALIEPPRYEGFRLVSAEYGVGDFSRSFNLSEEIDRDRIQARLQDGVLRLNLPKAEPAKARKIVIQAS